MDRTRLCLIALAVLTAGPMVAGCGSRSHRAPALVVAPPPEQDAFVLAQAQPAPAAPTVPAPSSEAAVGLPRVTDYRAIAELRDIYFDFALAVIRPDAAKTLDANAAWLRANPGYLVLIEGHADNRGLTSNKNELNLDLGEQRAQAAMNYIVAKGVPPSRITILSYGEERPQCTEQSDQCWSQNRRSRFLVKPGQVR